MKMNAAVCAVIAAWVATSDVQPARGQTLPATPPMVAFVDVIVVPMDTERVLPGQTVIIRDGRIAEIGAAEKVLLPAGAHRIDGRGKYLLPGLVDMHVHLGAGAGTAGDPAGRTLRLLLANGITTMRSMAGSPSQIVLREKLARGELLGPALYAAGPPFRGDNTPSVEAARQAVADQKRAGYDLIKVHAGIGLELFDAIVAAAREARLPVAGHVSADVGLARAMAAGQEIEHLDAFLEAIAKDGTRFNRARSQMDPGRILLNLDETKIGRVAAEVKQAGIWNGPTLALFERVASEATATELAGLPEMRYVPAQTRTAWIQQRERLQDDPPSPEERRKFVETRRKIVKALWGAGAGLLAGSDSPQSFHVPGFALHAELRALVAAGLTPYAAIAAATRNPADYLGAQGEFGIVAAGRRADLLLLDANPMADVGNLMKRTGVMVRGRWMPESELQMLLEEVAKAEQAPPPQRP